MILYHITPIKNLESILEKGILPDFNKKGISHWKDEHKKVFLTNDIDKIILEQAGINWVKRNNPIILEIELNEKDFKPHEYHFGGTYTYSKSEFVIDKIEPNKIIKHYLYDFSDAI